MRHKQFTIGELARRTGCKVQTIRYYETIGLLAPPPRSAGNHRLYGAGEAARLGFVRNARELGFSLEAIRTLLDLGAQPEQPCEEVNRIAEQRLDEVRARIRSLEALESELERVIGQCAGGRVEDCRIIQALAGQPAEDGCRR